MNKQWLLACMVALSLTHTSCLTDEMIMVDFKKVESRSSTTEKQVQNLIQQARNGETEAYKSLAYCYRDGNGVDKSYMNAIFMYKIYCRKTGKELKDDIELFNEENPYRLVLDLLYSHKFDEKTERKIAELRQVAPEEAKWIEALRTQLIETPEMLDILQEAEKEGSEIAGILQAFHALEKKDTTGYQQCLTRLATKHPFLHTAIAELYVEKYNATDNFTNIQKTIEHYYKADSFGMLSPRNANKLWSLYDYFNWKGLLEYDEMEVERLKLIMKTEK